MARPMHQLSHLFRLLQRGDALVGTQQPGARAWSLASDGRVIDDAIAAALLNRRFLGGRMMPAGDHLPGIEGVASQTWAWQATRPAPPRRTPCA